MPNVVSETQTTLGIKHSTAKTNKTNTIQRHRRHWAYHTQQRRPTKQKQSRDTDDIGHKTLNSEDKQNKNNPETWIVFVLLVFAVECFMPNVACVSGLFLFSFSSLLSVLCPMSPVSLDKTNQNQSRDTGDIGHKTLNSEDNQNKNNPETQATLVIKHSTAKTNKTKIIQRHNRHWA
jgi:hypothetical protein